MLDKLHIIISILAGIIFTVIVIILNESFQYWLPHIILVLILFYVFGSIAASRLKKQFIKKKLAEGKEDESIIEREEPSGDNSVLKEFANEADDEE
ncbi:MAG: hypothetical protein ACK5LT_08800 [Lachnospirales bacterium]